MANVLTTLSTVTCGHPPGKVQVQSQAKLAVGGGRVLVQAGIKDQTVADCGTKPASDAAGPTAAPCKTVSKVGGGRSTKLRAGGQPVMLDTLAGSTDGMVLKVTPQPFLAGVANQVKLRSV
jgi:hypothetical protein